MARDRRQALSRSDGVVSAIWEEANFSFRGFGTRFNSPTHRTLRVTMYLSGRAGEVLTLVVPRLIDNEEEGFGRNVGWRGHYYRVQLPMHEVWPTYEGSARDSGIVALEEAGIYARH